MLYRFALSLATLVVLEVAQGKGDTHRELRSVFGKTSSVTVVSSPICPQVTPIELDISLERSLSENTVLKAKFSCKDGTTYTEDLCSQRGCDTMLNGQSRIVTNFYPPTGKCRVQLLHKYTETKRKRGRTITKTHRLKSSSFQVLDETDSQCGGRITSESRTASSTATTTSATTISTIPTPRRQQQS